MKDDITQEEFMRVLQPGVPDETCTVITQECAEDLWRQFEAQNNRVVLAPRPVPVYQVMMDPRIYAANRVQWLVEVLRYAEWCDWPDAVSAKTWVLERLREAKLEANYAPPPPEFEWLTQARDQGRCRQNWRRKRDHAKWVIFQLRWLEDLLKCLPRVMDGFVAWREIVREMVTAFERQQKKCGCYKEDSVATTPRSGASIGLYG